MASVPVTVPTYAAELDLPAEYCPVSIGAKLIGDRWTLLIVREMLTGSSRFNEIHRGLPGISRSLLVDRLRYLERVGAVERRAVRERGNHACYALTPAGAALRPVLIAIGHWTVDWQFPEPTDEQSDAATLLWRLYRGLNLGTLPEGELCIQFRFPDCDPSTGYLRVDRKRTVTVCVGAAEHAVDVTATARPSVLNAVLFGHRSFDEAIADGSLVLDAGPATARAFASWFHHSIFADRVTAARQARSESAWGRSGARACKGQADVGRLYR